MIINATTVNQPLKFVQPYTKKKPDLTQYVRNANLLRLIRFCQQAYFFLVETKTIVLAHLLAAVRILDQDVVVNEHSHSGENCWCDGCL